MSPFNPRVGVLRTLGLELRQTWDHRPGLWHFKYPRGSRYLGIKELRLKDHEYLGFWGLLNNLVSGPLMLHLRQGSVFARATRVVTAKKRRPLENLKSYSSVMKLPKRPAI